MNNSIKTFYCTKNNLYKIMITKTAINQIKKIMIQYNNTKEVLLEMKQYGCAGFSYNFDTIENPTEKYLLFKSNEIKIYTQKEKIQFINGITIDFIQKGFNQTFKFNNPKTNHSCMCGKSFGI